MLVYLSTLEFIDNNFYLFGNTEEGRPVYICIYEHETYFYCKTRKETENINTKSKNYEKLELFSILDDGGIKLSRDIEIVNLEDSQSSNNANKPLPHYKVYVNDMKSYEKAKKIAKNENFLIPETPALEIKFFSDLNMNPVQWVEFDIPDKKGERTEDGVIWDDFIETISERKPLQFLMKSSSLKQVSDEDKLAPPMNVITFDAEMMSSRFGINESRAHPDPLIDEDVVYCLSMVERDTTNKLLGDLCLFITEQELKIANGNIINCDDEEELLMKMSEYFRKKDPDMINGYNIQGFDFPYIEKRSSSFSIPNYGRLSSFKYKKFGLNIELKIVPTQEYDSKSWTGAGGTWHSYTTPRAYGRVIVDTFNLVKTTKVSKGVEGALQSLKLNDVGKYFVNETKEDITYAETYLGYRSKKEENLAKIASYCVQDSILTWKVFYCNNGPVYLREASPMFMMDMNDVLPSGPSSKIYNKFLDKCNKKKLGFHIYGNKRNLDVKGGHVENPVVGKKTNVICVDFASMYPTTQMARNICLSTFSKLKPNLPEDQYDEYDIDVEVEEIETPAYYEDFVEDFNFEKIDSEEYIKEFFKTNQLDMRYKSTFLNMVRSENGCEEELNTRTLKTYFVKPEVRKGVFPEMLEELRKNRKYYKNMMKKSKEENNPSSYEVYNQRQGLVKIIMNSIYGVLGSTKGPLSCLEASSTITFFGRKMIRKVRDYLVEKGCQIIYGDTDSIMFQIPGYVETGNFNQIVSDEVIEYGKNIVKEINEFLPKPMEVEFEKIMHMLAVKKKHYLGVKVWEDGEKMRSVFVKGLAGIRGDSTPFAQNLFREVVRRITIDEDADAIKAFVSSEIEKLNKGEIPNDMLVVSAMLANDYKSETAPMNVYSKYLRKIGEVAEAGTKIAYIVAKQPEGSGKQPKSCFYRPPDTKEEIDYEHYKTRALRPVNEVLAACFEE